MRRLAPGHWGIGFGAGRADHFWPRQGRAVLGADALCGMIVLFGLALRARSWTLWLMGYAATLLTLVLAWRSR